MARTVKRCLTVWLEPEGVEEPKTNLSEFCQEEQPDDAAGKVIADYNPDVDSEGSEPKNEPDAQEEKEENSDTEYAKVDDLVMKHSTSG